MSDDLHNRLKTLVSYQTETGALANIEACMAYLEDSLRDCGWYVERFVSQGLPSLAATTRKGKHSRIMLAAHVDVVPAKPDQYNLTETDERLYGRGSFDMKFAAACYLQLAADLKDQIHEYDLGILFTADEEVGGADGTGYLMEQGYSAQVAVLPDGGNDWQLETGCNGVWMIRLVAQGRTAHGSRPWEGHNAILELTSTIHAIRDLFGEMEPLKSSLTVSQIQGGHAVNQVPDHAEATLDMRFVDEADYLEYRQRVEALIAEGGLTYTSLAEVDCGSTDINHPAIAAFMSTAQQVLGKPLGTCHSLGASDSHYLNKKDIPVIVIRPSGGDAHGEAEWVDKAGVQEFYEVLKTYVQSYGRG